MTELNRHADAVAIGGWFSGRCSQVRDQLYRGRHEMSFGGSGSGSSGYNGP